MIRYSIMHSAHRSLLVSISLLLAASCRTTIISRDGTKHKLPAVKDRITLSQIDTSRFVRQRFRLANNNSETAFKNGKRIVEVMEGTDLDTLAASSGRYLIYFWNPTCHGTLRDIRKLDSLSATGAHVMILSLRRSYGAIDAVLRTRHFSRYPYYTIEADKYSRLLLQRQIAFIKEGCPVCYEQYKGDLAAADYLLIENGAIHPVLYNDNTNLLRF